MNCRYVESRLSCYVDGELSGREMMLVRSHITGCSSCERELQELVATKRWLSAAPCAPVREGFERDLVATVLGTAEPVRWWDRLRSEARANWLAWSVGLAGLAAAVMIAVVPEQRDLFTRGPGSLDASIQGPSVPSGSLDPETRRLFEDHFDRRPGVPYMFPFVPFDRTPTPVLFER